MTEVYIFTMFNETPTYPTTFPSGKQQHKSYLNCAQKTLEQTAPTLRKVLDLSTDLIEQR